MKSERPQSLTGSRWELGVGELVQHERRRVLGEDAGDRTEPVALFKQGWCGSCPRGGAGLRQEVKRSFSAGVSLRSG